MSVCDLFLSLASGESSSLAYFLGKGGKGIVLQSIGSNVFLFGPHGLFGRAVCVWMSEGASLYYNDASGVSFVGCVY